MHKKSIRITRILRKSVIDTDLATRPVWVSFFQGSFSFFKIFSSSISYRATCDLSFFLTGCIGDKVKIDIKIYLLMLYLITAIWHQLGVNLSCIVAFHMLKTMFLLSIIKNIKISLENAVILKNYCNFKAYFNVFFFYNS